MEVFIGDLMDLSLSITLVKGKSLKVLPGVKKICNNYKLYYYCKQNHLDIMAKICLNHGTFLQSNQFMEIEDDQCVIKGVILELENK